MGSSSASAKRRPSVSSSTAQSRFARSGERRRSSSSTSSEQRTSNIAFVERAAKPPRGEVLPAIADALGVTIEELLAVNPQASARRRRPASRLERLMAEAAKLPRRRQQRIADTLEALLAQEAKS